MKRLLPLILCLITINIFAQDASQIDSEAKIAAFKKLQKTASVYYPGDANIDAKFYKLNLSFQEYPANYINGTVTMRAVSKSSNLTQIELDLKSNLTVSSVLLGSQSLQFSQSNDKLLISFTSPLNINQEFTIDITYSGSPTSGNGMISSASISFYDNSNSKKIIATLSEPYGSKDWWPCKDDPADKADSSEVWITADQWYTSVSNGTLTGVVDNGNGTKTYKWKNHYPIATYLISIAASNYGTYEDSWEYSTGKTLPIIHYCYPEKMTSSRKNAVDQTKYMLEIFSDKFGLYPFIKEKYGHAEFAWGGGMEHQTVTSMGSGAMSNVGVIAHELAHQWFGDMVTCKDWHHIWLNEGLASYGEAVYREGREGRNGYLNEILADFNGAKNAVGTMYVQNISLESEIFSSARSYKKGSAVTHMLRGVIGDSSKFFSMLRNYLNDPLLKYGVAVTEDLKRHAEAVSGANLDYFFNEWVYGENYPVYTINWWSSDAGGGFYDVGVTILQQANTNPTYFTMPVQFKFTTSAGDTTFTVFNNEQSQDFTFRIKGEPSQLSFDPDEWILKNVSSINKTDKPEPTNYTLNQNYPNPFNPSTTIKFSIPESMHVNLIVYDVLGREVAVLINEIQNAGFHRIPFSASYYNLPSGIYFYTLKTDSFIETKKMVLIK